MAGVALGFVESDIAETDIGGLSEQRIIVEGVFRGPAAGDALLGFIAEISQLVPFEPSQAP